MRACLALLVFCGCATLPAPRATPAPVGAIALADSGTQGRGPVRDAAGGRKTMSMYLTRFSYTAETWARLAQHPEDRRNAARAYIEAAGGKLHGFWYAFGEYDGYTLWEAPDNVAMASVTLALSAGGALSKCETTVLLTVDEALQALGKVEAIRYKPPGQ